VENVRTGERQLLRADCIVNSAGLWAQVWLRSADMTSTSTALHQCCTRMLKRLCMTHDSSNMKG